LLFLTVLISFTVSGASALAGGTMKKFVVLYSGGKAPTNPKEAEASMKQWTEWFGTLDGAVVDNGLPFGEAKTVTATGVREGADGNVSNGYGIFQAASLKEAAALLKGCPIIAEGGKVHVFDLMAM
jgi:hypothetical protein